MARKKPKQKERLPLDIPDPEPDWKISEKSKRQGKHWLPILRKQLDNIIESQHTTQHKHK